MPPALGLSWWWKAGRSTLPHRPSRARITLKNSHLLRSSEKTANALTRLVPEGIDVDYDNVEGGQLEVALTRMNDFGNIVSGGKISVSSQKRRSTDICTGVSIFLKRLTINGFVYTDPPLLAKYMASLPAALVAWLAQGKIKTKEEVVAGVDEAPEALVRMWKGEKFGKMVIKIGED
ncbi:NAD(P)-binding Rossmann-fold containing protein [Diaporthe eres]|nr:NAD(P)-binding Rossmann-fold containing protein [Diaporthe eres]